MLDDVITELVLSQIVQVAKNLINDLSWLFVSAVFEDSLNNSASVSVHTKFQSVISHRLNDKFNCLKRHLFNTFLNNVVTILVVNTVQHSVFQFRNQKLLLVKRYDLKSFLHYTTAIHGLSQFEDITKELFSQSGSLLISAILE